MIFIQVLTAMKNKYQLCRFQNWLIFWCLLFFPFHLNNGRGKWGWLVKPCQRIPSSFSHTCPQSCNLSCPQNGFAFDKLLFIDFAKAWSQRACSHIALSCCWQDCESREKTGAAAEEFSQRWGLCRPDSSAAICCLHRYFSMKSTTESVRPRLGIMRLGVVARHFSPPSQVIKTIVELLLTQRMGSTRSLCVSSMGALCWLCVPRAIVLCCAVLGGSRSQWSSMSLEAGFRAVFPFYPHYGCVFIESAEENASDSLDFSFIVFVP